MSVFSAMPHPVTVRTCIISVPFLLVQLVYHTAIGMSGNDNLSVKLNTSIAPDDAHAIDIKYHKTVGQLMYHVLRRETSEPPSEKLAGEIAAQIEFLTMTEMTLRSGKVVSMSELQYAFESILESNNVENSMGRRKALKQLLL